MIHHLGRGVEKGEVEMFESEVRVFGEGGGGGGNRTLVVKGSAG